MYSYCFEMRVLTIGHGRRTTHELVEALVETGVRTLVDVRRIPFSRRNPQFNQPAVAAALAAAGFEYRHAEELGGLRADEPGQERFPCIRVPAFRSYAARMSRPEWQAALADVLESPVPCLMCAETPWQRCHRRLISELLVARGHEVVHVIRPGEQEPHKPFPSAETRNGELYVCGERVA
ncbi:MAG: hypothetical protein QOK13_200 [Gaiellaceae bacterium]|jgi:uncharacterized protein (DUF488 family)|nr:hypothetical protein [Gaiellaceae bacterium]